MCELVGASALRVQFGSMVLWTCGAGVQMDTGLTSHARMDSGIDSRIDSGMEYVMLRLWTPDGYRIGIAFQLVFWN